MNYIQMFRPLFSFGAHAALSAQKPGEEGPNARAIFSELEQHINSTRANRKPGNAEFFDSAWFAACAWLDEKLAPLRALTGNDANTRLQRRYFDTVNAGEEFFDRLDRLLAEQNDTPLTERADVIDLYAACIDLGFLGKHYLPGEQNRLEEYRQQCAEAYAKAHGDTSATRLLQNEPDRNGRIVKPVGMLVFWVVPVAVTLGLFLLYRFLLSSIYGQVVN